MVCSCFCISLECMHGQQAEGLFVSGGRQTCLLSCIMRDDDKPLTRWIAWKIKLCHHAVCQMFLTQHACCQASSAALCGSCHSIWMHTNDFAQAEDCARAHGVVHHQSTECTLRLICVNQMLSGWVNHTKPAVLLSMQP